MTEDGLTGLGDATLNGRELAVATYLSEHVVPLLIGRDARRIEDTWHYLYKGVYWRKGAVTMTAIAAVDMALWDIAGKAANKPVYQLFGGASREEVLVYSHASGATIEETVAAVADHAQGRVSGDSGAVRGPGPRTRLRRRTGRAAVRARRAWRAAVGEHLEHRALPPVRAGALRPPAPGVRLRDRSSCTTCIIGCARLKPRGSGKSLEPYHLFWMEDPVPAELQEGFRTIRQHTTTPIAVGEVFDSIYDGYRLIQEQLIDYIRASVVHAGGLTHLRKIATLAEIYHVRTGCHGASDLSPVTMAAALHFDLSVHNFGIQEHMGHTRETDRVFPHAYTFRDGAMYPGDRPGLGVDLDETLAASYPYQRAYLPVARLEDGTVHSW